MTYTTSSLDIISAIQKVIGPSQKDRPIALHEPNFIDTKAWLYVKECLDTGWVSTAGEWVKRFEDELARLTGASHVIAVNNGTVALRLALHLVGVRQNDEVLTTSMSFVATSNAIAHNGAIPHFIDIVPTSLGIDPDSLSRVLNNNCTRREGQVFNNQTGRRISAILPVHVFGHPADIVEICSIADEWGLPVVEDSAEALGSLKNQKHCGLFGSIGVLSFNGNKLITTGGGGAIITDDASLAKRARHLSTTAKLSHPWEFEHDEIGWNDRMPNINAALGVAQLEMLHQRLSLKRALATSYHKSFEPFDDIEIIREPPNCLSNHWLVSMRFKNISIQDSTQRRDSLLHLAYSKGLLIRPVWRPLHTLPIYSACPRQDLSVTVDQASRVLSLPSSPQLFTSAQQNAL